MDRASHQDILARIGAISASSEEALVVVGEVGAGKTRLLRSAFAGSDIRAEIVHIRPGESSVSLSGIAALLDVIRGEHSSHFARQFRLHSNEPAAVFAAANDVLDLIKGFHLPPTLLLIDRIESMDEASQSLVGVIAGHLTGTGLHVIGTARQIDPDGPLADLPAVQLAPWTMDELVEHGRAHVALSHDATLRILAGYAGGNPGILLELISMLHPDQLDGSTWLTLPPRITDSLKQVTGWPEVVPDAESRLLLELISVAPLCHIDALTQLRPDSVDRVEDLVDAGLLQVRGSHVSLVDSRLRAHIYWSQAAYARHERHRELAAVVEIHDHLLAGWHRSFIAMDESVVIELLDAAIWLAGHQRVPEAIEFTERALRGTDVADDHTMALVRLCSLLLRLGEFSLVVRYSAYAMAPHTAPGLLLELAAMRLTAQLLDQQIMRDEEALALVALHAPDNADRAADLLTLAAIYRAERWEVREARALIKPALSMLDAVDPQTRYKVTTMLEILDALEGNLAPADDLDLTNRPPHKDLPPDLLLMRGRTLTFQERYPEARHALQLVLNHPIKRDRMWSDLAMYASIHNEIAAGHFRPALEDIDTWGTSSPWINRSTAASAMIAAWYQYAVGETTEAQQIVDTVLDFASKESSIGLRARALALRGSIDMLGGDPESAIMNLRHVSMILRELGNPALPRHWTDYVEALALTDRLKESHAAVATLERRVTSHPSRWGALALARCRAIAETGPKSLALFGEAVQLFEQGEQPYELGRTLKAFGDRQALLGEEGDAHHSWVAAITAFNASGADAWARSVWRPTGETPAKQDSSRLERLTTDEREVVDGLLQGMRNREIAELLHVSVRTVELRLTHIYRAFDVRSRGELAALLRGRGPQGDHTS